MASKDLNKKQWTDPKDFGLPYVDIQPIQGKATAQDSVEEEVKSEVVAPTVEVQAATTVPVEAKVDVIPAPETKAPERKKEEKKAPAKAEQKELKSNSAWAWIVVVLALVIVGFVVWKMQFAEPSAAPSEKPAAQEKTTTNIPPAPEVKSSEIASTDESQLTVNQDTIKISTEVNPNISNSVDSGTTIAQSVSGKLIRIEAQEEKPQYFIVVGSLPSESDALKMAPGYQSKAEEVYLILPYSESKNYRLAIGKFRSFRMAAEELEKIKPNFTEELWILKY